MAEKKQTKPTPNIFGIPKEIIKSNLKLLLLVKLKLKQQKKTYSNIENEWINKKNGPTIGNHTDFSALYSSS